ncbi:MAG: ornithine carbamoyltransferase, partial [Candidatus Aenigmatarchaeota archaeon]
MTELKNFLSMRDLSKTDILNLLEKSEDLKGEDPEKQSKYLEHDSLGMIFAKPSTRTRVSFEV